MSRVRYLLEPAFEEATAPAGYYTPRQEGFVEYQGRKVLYTLGDVCIETSCCGTGSWNYVRVQGYLVRDAPSKDEQGRQYLEVDTIEDQADRVAVSRLLGEKHPGARVEFR